MRLTREQAQRIAVRAQLLDGSATGVLDTVRRIGFLQLDPTARVERTHWLVLWSRLGEFDRAELERLLWEERALFEWVAFIHPVEALPALRARMKRWPLGDTAWPTRARDWLAANASFRRYVLAELRRRGPLPMRELEDRAVVPWPSSGWTGDRNTSQMLEFLAARGEVAVAGRDRGQRVWDLSERVWRKTTALPARAADAYLAETRLRSLGIDRRGPGTEVSVEGADGSWRVDPEALERADDPVPTSTTLLSPFDRLIHDRDRAEALFGFRYRMEIYVPKAKREYGFYVLPVLHGHELVGRIDPEHDRVTGTLIVNRSFPEEGRELPPLDSTLASLAAFVGAGEVDVRG